MSWHVDGLSAERIVVQCGGAKSFAVLYGSDDTFDGLQLGLIDHRTQQAVLIDGNVDDFRRLALQILEVCD